MWGPFEAWAAMVAGAYEPAPRQPPERDVLTVAVARLDSTTRRLECRACSTTWCEKPYVPCWSCDSWRNVIPQ